MKEGYAWLAGLNEIRNVTWVDLPTSHWPMWSRPRELRGDHRRRSEGPCARFVVVRCLSPTLTSSGRASRQTRVRRLPFLSSRRTSLRLVQVLAALVVGERSLHLLLRDADQVVQVERPHANCTVG